MLLERQAGSDKYVVLHLVCQGVEIILKALLLFLDYDKYIKQQQRHGHDLKRVISVATNAFGLRPMRQSLAEEMETLNNFYSKHLLRYDGLHDIFIDSTMIESGQLLRRIAAVMRLAEREIARSAEPSHP